MSCILVVWFLLEVYNGDKVSRVLKISHALRMSAAVSMSKHCQRWRVYVFVCVYLYSFGWYM
jgi:hypothetical protein